jgi:folylpolyglutamate synthase/dihydropteroate synthase
MAKAIAPVACTVLAVSPQTERAMPAEEIERIFKNLGISVRQARSVASALSFIKRKRRFEHPIIVTGSHFVVGEALAFFRGKKYLTINQ